MRVDGPAWAQKRGVRLILSYEVSEARGVRPARGGEGGPVELDFSGENVTFRAGKSQLFIVYQNNVYRLRRFILIY